MAPFVVIPFGYEELPETCRSGITPIYIARIDRRGNWICMEWFERGVMPAHGRLVRIARDELGDSRYVSEVAETALHNLWDRNGPDLGRDPDHRVAREARWVARDIKAGHWRDRKYQAFYTALDALDEKMRDQMLVDQRDYRRAYEQGLTIARVEKRLVDEGRAEMLEVCRLLRNGYTWDEIGTHLGERNGEAVKKRFQRCMKPLKGKSAGAY